MLENSCFCVRWLAIIETMLKNQTFIFRLPGVPQVARVRAHKRLFRASLLVPTGLQRVIVFFAGLGGGGNLCKLKGSVSQDNFFFLQLATKCRYPLQIKLCV